MSPAGAVSAVTTTPEGQLLALITIAVLSVVGIWTIINPLAETGRRAPKSSRRFALKDINTPFHSAIVLLGLLSLYRLTVWLVNQGKMMLLMLRLSVKLSVVRICGSYQ